MGAAFVAIHNAIGFQHTGLTIFKFILFITKIVGASLFFWFNHFFKGLKHQGIVSMWISLFVAHFILVFLIWRMLTDLFKLFTVYFLRYTLKPCWKLVANLSKLIYKYVLCPIGIALYWVFSKVKMAITTVFKFVWKWMKKFFTFIGSILAKIFKCVGLFLWKMFRCIGQVLKKIFTPIGKGIVKMFQYIGSIFKAIGKGIAKMFKCIGKIFK